MITEEHLLHWLKEMQYQLTGLTNELRRADGIISGIKINDKLYFSFEYAKEKSEKVERIIKSIRDDMANDES